MPGNKDSRLTGVFRSGTAAGILVALAVIGLFILAATFLKSLVFGIILACFFLPLEKFFENRFFRWPGVQSFFGLLDRMAWPFRALKDSLAGKTSGGKTDEDRRSRLIFRSCVFSAVSFLGMVILSLLLVGYLVVPAAVAAGKSLKESHFLKNALVQIESETLPENAPDSTETGRMSVRSVLRELIRNLRETVPEYIKKNHKDLANLVFQGGRGLVAGILAAVSSLGVFAFDLLLCAFFFFFFLQHLAVFMSGNNENESIGNWCVRGIFSTRWMPEVSENTRAEAVEIIDWIAKMFIKWIRGYLWIIIIETLLYLTAFTLCGVPYAPVLAVVAGLTILLPFLGPIASFLLTAVCCLVFCREHTMGSLIGVCITYLGINGILEQLFLYPKLVGGAIELSTVETIIAVLLGGLAAGIPGMIFAVPAAAILKYLVPKIYQVMRRPKL